MLLCALVTGLTSLANDFVGLLWPRLLYGLASCGVEPSFIKWASYYFKPEERGMALSLFFICVYAGSSLASLSLILAQGIGWKLSYFSISLCSFAIVLATILPLRDLKYSYNEED